MVSPPPVVVLKRSEIISRVGGRFRKPLRWVRPRSLSYSLRVRGGDDEPSAGKPLGQLLVSIALGNVDLLEPLEAL